MRKLLTWIAVTLGIAALVRRLRRRRSAEVEPTAGGPVDDPARELREKLAASRAESPADAPAETTAGATVEERRAEVHEDARAALEEMRSGGDDA